jgi:hypothetical protein
VPAVPKIVFDERIAAGYNVDSGAIDVTIGNFATTKVSGSDGNLEAFTSEGRKHISVGEKST